MPKRTIACPYRKSPKEQKMESRKQYAEYVKSPSKINPIFLRVPDYGMEGKKWTD